MLVVGVVGVVCVLGIGGVLGAAFVEVLDPDGVLAAYGSLEVAGAIGAACIVGFEPALVAALTACQVPPKLCSPWPFDSSSMVTVLVVAGVDVDVVIASPRCR